MYTPLRKVLPTIINTLDTVAQRAVYGSNTAEQARKIFRLALIMSQDLPLRLRLEEVYLMPKGVWEAVLKAIVESQPADSDILS